MSDLSSLSRLDLMSNDIKYIRPELKESISTWGELNLANNPVNNINDFIEHRSRLKLGYNLVTQVVDENKLG